MTPIQILGVLVLVLCGGFLLLRAVRARRRAVPKGSPVRALTLFVGGEKYGELQNAKLRMRRLSGTEDLIDTELSAYALILDSGAKVDLVALLFEGKTTEFTFVINDVAHVLDGRVLEAELLSEFREGTITGAFKIAGYTRRAPELIVVRDNKWTPPVAITQPSPSVALARALNGGVLKVSVANGVSADA